MADFQEKVVNIKVIGVGGAGNNVINRMISSGVGGVEFIAVNTDKQDLNKSKCENKIQIGEKLTGGMGAGSKPEIGQKSAEESKNVISQALDGTDMVFITAGMGGGTGTGAAPIIAQIAHDKGILTVGVVTKPFKFEGANRMRQAEMGIANLTDKVDSLIIIPNDRLKFVTDQKITFANAFGIADDVLKQAVSSISELVGYSEHVIINLDFADVSLQDVRADEEVDPAGAEVESQPHGAAAIVDHRVASREREPADRVEIDRSGDVVEGLVFPETGRIQQADADFVAPYFVFESGVDRCAQHARHALGSNT